VLVLARSARHFCIAMMTMNELSVDFHRKLDIELLQRVQRAVVFLEQLIKKAYAEELKASHGEAGALGGITSNVVHQQGQILAQIGISKAADYLKYLEWGVKPGNDAEWPAYSKMPPVKNIYAWLSLARITTPQTFVDQAKANAKRAESHRKHPEFDKKKNAPWYSSDPQMVFAFFVALKLKNKGRPALRIIERKVKDKIDQVTKYIEGKQ
jgi:hypothetical protein